MTTPGHEDNQGMSLYIVLYDYDPKLVGLKNEVRADHRAFMHRLNSLGMVLSTGRTTSSQDQGSLTIMLARDADETSRCGTGSQQSALSPIASPIQDRLLLTLLSDYQAKPSTFAVS